MLLQSLGSAGVSNSAGGMGPPVGPPKVMLLIGRPERIGPARSSTKVRTGTPKGTSTRPTYSLWPVMEYILVPLSPLPMSENHLPPLFRIGTENENVSVLFTHVGFSHTPASTERCSLTRGMARPPSIDACMADASPDTYEPKPRRVSMSSSKSNPRT